MNFRRAKDSDTGRILELLNQVARVHQEGRPDLFKAGSRKYGEKELQEIFRDEKRPIFVAADENDEVLGYAFCKVIQYENDAILTDIRTLYIDDLCVDEHQRGQKIGEFIYCHVKDYACCQGFYNLTLNVWSCNTAAQKFYEKMGLKPQKIGMECIL